MAIPSKQIGWGTEDNLLWQISKQLERLTQVTGNIPSPIISTPTLQQVVTAGSTSTIPITANSFKKSGGTVSQLLAANGDSIIAGTNITISGGTISSTVGGTNLSPSQTASNFTINSDTGTDATIPLGDGTLAGASLNDYTTAEKNKLGAISGTNTGDQNLSGFQLTSAKDAISGYAGLDGSGKINPLQLPALAITDTFVVATQAAMLALTAEVGDVAVRTDLNKSFILRLTGASTLANWQELLTPTDAVSSVFGRSGTVSAQNNDYTTDQILETATKVFLTPAEKTAIAHTNRASLDLVSGTNTGDNATNSQYSGLAASKQDVLGFTPVKFIINSFPYTSITGLSGDQSFGSFLIPANTLSSNTSLRVQARVGKSGTAGAATLRIKVNSTNNFATATTIGFLTLAATTPIAIMTRNPFIQGTNFIFGSTSTTFVTDETTVFTIENIVYFDVTQDNYFFVSIALVNTSDLVQLKNFRITD